MFFSLIFFMWNEFFFNLDIEIGHDLWLHTFTRKVQFFYFFLIVIIYKVFYLLYEDLRASTFSYPEVFGVRFGA